MKVKSFSIKNKFINYENLSFDFSGIGVYKISGINGSGKTSIMEKLVFGKYNAEFSSDALKTIWKRQRGSLFTYVPQGIIEYNINVAKYLCKGNLDLKTENVFEILSKFGFDKTILDKRYSVLSGGEKKKLQIICGLLKNTPYIFFDEPTNNLDNASVETFSKMLKEISKYKTVILISHDERLKCDLVAEYNLSGNKIETENYILPQTSEFVVNKAIGAKLYRVMFSLFRNYAQIVTVCFLICAFLILSIVVHNDLTKVLTDNDFERENIIYVRPSDSFDNDLIGVYIRGENLSLSDETRSNYLDLEDVYVDLKNLEGIERLYFMDHKYEKKLYNMMRDGTIGEELHFVACPKEVYDDFWKYISWGGIIAIDHIDGEIPQEFSNEVAMSKKLLINYFGYNETTVDSAIGDMITLNVQGENKQFKIVGFNYYDIVTVSYDTAYNYGVYCYDESTYEDYVREQVEYEIEINGTPGWLHEMIIVTKPGYERSIFNHIVTNYPCGELYSHYYGVVWQRTYNMSIFMEWITAIIIFSIILSVSFVIINMQSANYNKKVLQDFGDYYINRRKIFNLYRIFTFISYLSVTFLALAMNSIFSGYAYMSNWYIVISSAIILIPTTISLFVKKKNKS